MSFWTQMVIKKAVTFALAQLRKYMSTGAFVQTADEVLDRIEDYYKQGSFKDEMIEQITGEIRMYFNIPDKD